MSKPIAFNEKKFQRECDAQTLAEAKTIMNDPKRLKGAASEAQKMAKEKEEQAKAMKQVARKAPKESQPKGSGKGKKK